ATEITAGNSKETATNIPQYGVEYVSSLSEAKEVDWFKFTTLSSDAYYSVKLKNYSLPGYDNSGQISAYCAPNIYLYDANMQVIDKGNNNIVLNHKLENNAVYYIKFYMGSSEDTSTGNYEISINYRFDATANEMGNAKSISLNTPHIDSLDGTKDIDWFKFTSTNLGEYKITLKNYDLAGYDNSGQISEYYAPNIYVYDAYSQQLAHKNNNITFSVDLEANTTYYIKIQMGSSKATSVGNYAITVSTGTAITPPDTPLTPPATNKTLSSISVITLPKKTDYSIGESLDTTGMAVKAKYSDGTSAVVTNYRVSGFDSSKAGTSVVSVSYSENGITKTTSFSVTVNEADGQAPGDNGNGGFSFDAVIEFFNGILAFFAEIVQFIIDLFSSLA
ncbi:MAG: bacterial Ig-like domain-containing protein, partial [Clostridia bacterium]|nr:bacterial Ig-like domain-containing protein [Clostridia bacterium]